MEAIKTKVKFLNFAKLVDPKFGVIYISSDINLSHIRRHFLEN
jgi:hypothetical protein